MNSKNNNTSVGFKLNRITTEQFAVFTEFFDKTKDKIEISIGLKFGLEKELRIIAVLVKVQLEQDNKPFLVLEVANHFDIEEQSWNNLEKTENGLVIPQNLASHLVMITIGTLRGALHCKTEHTEFNHFVLPTINVTQLVESDVILD